MMEGKEIIGHLCVSANNLQNIRGGVNERFPFLSRPHHEEKISL